MAAIALQRRVNINTRAIGNPSCFLHLFSSSSSTTTSKPNVQHQHQNTTHSSSSSSPSPSPSSYYRWQFAANKGGKFSLDAIRKKFRFDAIPRIEAQLKAYSDVMKQMRSVAETKTNGGGGAMRLSQDTESLKLRPLDRNQRESPMVIRGGGDSFQKLQMSSDQDEAKKSVSKCHFILIGPVWLHPQL